MAQTEMNKKTSEFLVTVTNSGKEWQTEIKSSENHLLENVSVKGFRKGKAPREVALKQILKAEIFSHAVTHVLDKLAKEAAKEVPKELMVLDAPTYLVKGVDEKKIEITFVYPIYPEVKLPEYKNLGIKYEEQKVDAKLIKDEIKKVEGMNTSTKPKAGKIAKGDVVKFDFEGFVDGKTFEGGKAEGFDLEIGSGQFIPGFEDQMIGLAKGDTKDVKVTFPKEYQAENLKGKDATFKIKVHEVSSKTTAALDDAAVKKLGIKDVATVAKFKTYIEDVFKLQFAQQARAKFQREAFDKLLAKTQFTLPAAVIAKEMQQVSAQMKEDLKKQNITIEQYMQFTGQTQEQVNSQFKASAETRLKDAIIFAEIAKAEKIELKDADYEKEYVKLAKVYQTTEEGVKGMVTKQQMQIPMTNDRVIDVLIKLNSK